jgi:hypothetical protein
MHNDPAGGLPLVGCSLLLIQYILEAVSSIRDLRTRLAVVTRDPLDMNLEVLFGNNNNNK